MYGCLLIGLLFAAGVAGVTGFGDPCVVLEGIAPICLDANERVIVRVIMVALIGLAAFVAVGRPGRR